MKAVPYFSKFHEYLSQNLSDAEVQQLPDLLGCSPHRRTAILKQPEKAVHDEVLLFARLLRQSVSFLHDSYGLGAKGMTEREKSLHRSIHEQVEASVLNQ